MKIVVPIMPTSLEEVREIDLGRFDQVDIIEWRADFLPHEDILQVAPAVFEKFAGREVIFTLRTSKEGGQAIVDDQAYVDLLKAINDLYQPDYIDFEYYSHQAVFEQMFSFSNLVLSYHNVTEMPENLMEILSELTGFGPKVVKVAVMPRNEQDVLDLMNFTRGFKALNPGQEYATMAMGKLGKLSRISSVLTGTSWSFAYLEKASAPGQIELKDMVRIREVLLSED